MKEMLEQMMRHAVWADQRTEASLRALPDIPDAALRIFAHLGTTEWIYLPRLQGDDPFSQDFWPFGRRVTE